MSTRSNIKVTEGGNDFFYLYHHSDGYPEHVGKYLYEALKTLPKYHDEATTKLVKEPHMRFELTTCIHGDIEWYYEVWVTKKVLKIYSVHGNMNNKKFKHEVTINVTKDPYPYEPESEKD